MTEIKMDLSEPRGYIEALKAAAAGLHTSETKLHLDALRGMIADQLPKPAVKEPTAFGSIVRADCAPGLYGVFWQKSPMRGKHYWESTGGTVALWSELSDVEVLRVGIGETYPHASGDAVVLGPETVKSSDGAVINHKGENYYPRSDGDGSYNRGRRDAASAIHRDVSALRDSTPLVTERRAYDKILAVIAVLRGES